MCESPYGNQDFPPLANGITLYQSLRKPHSAMNTGPITYPITKMGVASAFEHTQYSRVAQIMYCPLKLKN